MSLYAVFGNPIAHSKSPEIHHAFAASLDEQITYRAIEAPIDGFDAAIAAFRAQGGLGANVTVPFKTDAAALADEVSEAVRLCEASNCLKFEDGKVLAENFDGIGLVRDIEINLNLPLAGKRVLIAGAGGATRGIVQPILTAGVRELVIANRTLSKAQDICDLMGHLGPVVACSYEALSGPFDLVLNSTSASLSAAGLPIPEDALAQSALAYDLAYGKGKTPFLATAESAGAKRIADGVGMLVEQAAEAYQWWRGTRPDTSDIIAKMTVPLK